MNTHIYFDIVSSGEEEKDESSCDEKKNDFKANSDSEEEEKNTSDSSSDFHPDDDIEDSSDSSMNWSEDGDASETITPSRVKSQFREQVDMKVHQSLENHLKIVKGLSQAEYQTIIGRVSDFIGWIMNEESVNQSDATALIFASPNIFIQYLLPLKGEFNLKSGTIYNIILDFKKFAEYMGAYEKVSVQEANTLFTTQSRIANRQKKKDINARKTLENLEDELKWAPGGKKELIALLWTRQSFVDRIVQRCMDGKELSNTEISLVVDWIVSLLFVANPQGRSQAIRLLPLTALNLLKEQRFVTSRDFKTSEKYGYQAIACSAVTWRYIEVYVLYFRSLQLGRWESPPEMFLNGVGNAFQDIGRCLTRCFGRFTPYHITSSTLRAMFETDAVSARDEGVLTQAEVDDVTRNNQHSSATSRNFYLKRRAGAVGQTAMSVHDKLYATDDLMHSPSFKLSTDDTPFVPFADESSDDEDGVALGMSPTKRRRQRIDWTTDELLQLRLWVTAFERTCGFDVNKNWRECCAAMTQTGVFVPSHLTPTALREAWRREQAKRSLSSHV
jgi:hypothetical protein